MTDIRKELQNVMRETILDQNKNGNWSYWFYRPISGKPTKLRKYIPGIKYRGDCSKGVQFICWWVPGCPDPMDNGWADWGNSQTLCVRLDHVGSPRDLLVGDIVTFGNYGSEHAAMVVEADPVNGDPLLWSFGHQGAPNLYRLSHDKRPQQYRRLPVAIVLTEDDMLRARDDWFAWVAWKLGEGPWKLHGKASPKVRPNVPKVIPMKWWLELAKFLRRRKKGNKSRMNHK